MGCWNGTCGISNLPVKYGEKIRAVLIVGNASVLGSDKHGPPWRQKDVK